MKYKYFYMIVAITFLMLGCKANNSSAIESVVSAPAPAIAEEAAATKISPAQLLAQKLNKKMPYADFRKILLGEGWLPLKTESCRENVGDGGLICLQIPEIDTCSGDGHCVMWFAEGASLTKLRVSTYGDYRHWDQEDRKSELAVSSWEFSTIAVTKSPAICPSQNFEEFLKKFSTDRGLRLAFTAPLVKVRSYLDNDEKGYAESITYVPKEEYKAFFLTYKNDGYYVEPGTKAISLVVTQEKEGTYLVKVPFTTEGASYRFRNQDGCWYLIEDPEPAAP